ncbi:outer membrane lipid asymmetry maintenance protein MlaD [Pseudoruegeria sp. HB172150]|uniref:outer membrane lipid asymmetry maintenance protein MlaD n=1 Tax=Pseudoruegeria sp. HB172150 TaxID=2721164 RepID=UPI001556CC87|nr:outer membrane lipid asymmetry maintenance protein MlaD [Pseudoruegeria sp. HB172150]
MAERTSEILVGAAVLAVAGAFLFYAGQIAGFTGGQGGVSEYTASFRSVEGITVGTDVRLAGVKVGTVVGLELDPVTYRAETRLTVDENVVLTDDTAAVIASEGLLGGSFVEIVPGGSPVEIEPGGEIYDTQSALSLVSLLMKFVSGDSEEAE